MTLFGQYRTGYQNMEVSDEPSEQQTLTNYDSVDYFEYFTAFVICASTYAVRRDVATLPCSERHQWSGWPVASTAACMHM